MQIHNSLLSLKFHNLRIARIDICKENCDGGGETIFPVHVPGQLADWKACVIRWKGPCVWRRFCVIIPLVEWTRTQSCSEMVFHSFKILSIKKNKPGGLEPKSTRSQMDRSSHQNIGECVIHWETAETTKPVKRTEEDFLCCSNKSCTFSWSVSNFVFQRYSWGRLTRVRS